MLFGIDIVNIKRFVDRCRGNCYGIIMTTCRNCNRLVGIVDWWRSCAMVATLVIFSQLRWGRWKFLFSWG
uniref:Uncharacterized protein n=1 Tax=Octopus bimaculoides TaxID=37653 RepID=A0A0L8G0H5_OCTBM